MISRIDQVERLISGNFPFRPRMLAASAGSLSQQRHEKGNKIHRNSTTMAKGGTNSNNIVKGTKWNANTANRWKLETPTQRYILFLLVTEETLHTQQHSLSDHALPSYVDRSALVIYFSWTLYIGREKGAKISALQAGIVTRLPRRHLHVRQSYRQLHGSEHIPLGAPACKPNLHVAACVRACILYNIAA